MEGKGSCVELPPRTDSLFSQGHGGSSFRRVLAQGPTSSRELPNIMGASVVSVPWEPDPSDRASQHVVPRANFWNAYAIICSSTSSRAAPSGQWYPSGFGALCCQRQSQKLEVDFRTSRGTPWVRVSFIWLPSWLPSRGGESPDFLVLCRKLRLQSHTDFPSKLTFLFAAFYTCLIPAENKSLCWCWNHPKPTGKENTYFSVNPWNRD